MKVQKSVKKQQPPPKDIALLIEKILQPLKTPVQSDEQAQRDLIAVLEPVTVWTYPRGDLTNWVPVLDAFDEALEGLITLRAVVSLRPEPFTKTEKDVILHVLRLLKLLLVNCTNRKLFASYDRLGSLLYSLDLDIVETALLVLIRPAMQYSSTTPYVNDGEHSIRQHLRALAAGYDTSSSGWEQLRELGWDMHRIATDPADFQMPPEQRRLKITTHRRSSAARGYVNPSQLESPTSALRLGGPEAPPAGSSLVTPQRPSAVLSTPKRAAPAVSEPSAIDLGDIEALKGSTSVYAIVADLADKVANQPEDIFEAIAKIRFFMSLGDRAARRRLLSVRLLSLATYFHIQADESKLSTFFIYNPETIPQLASLVSFDRGVGYDLQAGALVSLEALARNRPTTADVLSALNANVNHGVLFTLIKGFVKRLVQDQAELPFDFVDAVIAMISMLTQTPAHASMMITAGILPLLLELLQSSSPSRATFIPRAAGLIDSIIYSSPNAFAVFCNASGLDILNARIKTEIDMCLQEDVSPAGNGDAQDTVLFHRVTPVKALLRSIHRMMQSSGTAEGLRNLIDSELPKSLKRIYEASDKLGPVVFGLAINVMATFVHNEPTSLSILQELELPQMLYDRIEPGLMPSLEVVCAVPNAIGAICLNQVGLDMTLARPKLIENMVMIMVASAHDTIMSVPGNPRAIGASLDELVRHHPALRPVLLRAVDKLLDVVDKGDNFDSKGQEGTYDLVPKWMLESRNGPAPVAPASFTIESNPMLHHFQKVFGLLEGLLHQPAICKEFVDNDGIGRIFRIIELGYIPTHFSASPAGASIVRVLRVIAHIEGARLLEQLARHVDRKLDDVTSFYNEATASSEWSALCEFASEEQQRELGKTERPQQQFRYLCQAATVLVFFADALSHISQQQARLAGAVLSTLTGENGKRLDILGKLQRSCTRQAIALKHMSDAQQMADANASLAEGAALDSPALPVGGVVTIDPIAASSGRSAASAEQKPFAAHLKPLRSVGLRIAGAVGSMLQGSIKALGRRHIDRAQAKSADECSSAISNLLIANVRSALPDPLSDNHGINQNSGSGLDQSPSYRSFVLGLCSGLLYDGRTTNGSLQLPLYLSFQDQGGVGALVELAHAVMTSIEGLTAVPKEERTQAQQSALVHALANLQQVFSLLRSLVSTKSLVESPQAASFVQREVRESEQKLFPHARLVKARLDILPAANRLWNASWLMSTPQAVMRAAVQTFLHIMRARREELPAAPVRSTAPSHSLPVVPRQPIVADPARIDQLAEMGFTRQQAEGALLRTRNNITTATELLLTTPHLFTAPPPAAPASAPAPAPLTESTQVEPVPQASAESGSEEGEPSISSDTQSPAAGSAQAETAMDVDRTSSGVLSEHEDTLRALNSLRDSLRADVGSRAIALVDDSEDLVFDIRAAFPTNTESVSLILERISDVVFNYTPELEKVLAGRLRLLAVLCQGGPGEPPLELEGSLLQQAMRLVSALIGMTLSPAPRWLAATLLVAESLLLHAERVTQAELDQTKQPVIDISGFPEARSDLLRVCLDTLRSHKEAAHVDSEQPSTHHENYLATLRLLVGLTRHVDLAKAFAKAGGLPLMVAAFKNPTNRLQGCHPLVTMITRHLVEDDNVLRFTMQCEIKRWLSPNRNKVSDVPHFLRQLKQVALRSPGVFLDAVAEECALVSPAPVQEVYHVRAKTTLQSATSLPLATTATEAMHVDDPFNSAAFSGHPGEVDGDGVLAFLFAEIDSLIKEDNAAATVQDAKEDPIVEPSMVDSDTSSKTNAKKDAKHEMCQQRRTYACLLLQLLTELLGSYLPCKMAFLVTHRRRKDPAAAGLARPRHVFLAALINEWVCGVRYDDVASPAGPEKDEHSQTRIAISAWASSAVIALCADIGGVFDLKEGPSELVTVRKIVLDLIAKAIKDTAAGHLDDDQRYGRLWSLSELVLRLLTTKSASAGKGQDDSSLHVAKIMLEKNFVALLTTALGEVDLEHSKIKLLLATVIRPLEQLSKISIKMGKTDKKDLDDTMDVDSSSDSEASSEDMDVEEDMSDDLEGYRNSSLAMYTMGASDDEIDDDDEEDSEEGYDEELGPDPDSDETSDEDEDMEDGEDVGAEGMGDDGDELDWTDEDEDEEVLDDPQDGEGVFTFDEDAIMEGDEEEDDSQDDEDEEEFDGELFDEGEEGDDGEMAEMDMSVDEDMGSEDEINEEDAAALEDMERFAEDLGYELDHSDSLAMFENSDYPGLGPQPSGPWGWVPGSGSGGSRPHERLLDRSLGAGLLGASDAVATSSSRNRNGLQHPLLAEPAAVPPVATGRRPLRAHTGVNGLVTNIENLLGQEAAQTLERLITQGRLSGADAIRIDVDQDEGGEVILSVGGRQVVVPPQEGSNSFASPAGLIGEFVPRPTSQRWLEELDVTHGTSAPSRVEAMINHVINRLLPDARRTALEDAERLKREQEEQRQLEEKERMKQAEAAVVEAARTLPALDEAPTNSSTIIEDSKTPEPAATSSVSAPADSSTNSETLARVTVSIYGRDVDITDTGIDLEFLEALPNEMRADVVEQHLREQARQQQRAPLRNIPEQAPQINSEFLDALPPDIRAEVIQQEALEHARRSEAPTRAVDGQPAPANFLASLDNDLRDVVLMDQANSMLGAANGTLTPQLLAMPADPFRHNASHGQSSRKKSQERDAIQLLDRQGVASLVRLLFFPDVQRTNHLLRVLVNLCQNSKTRADLLDSLLTIVQEGSGESLAGERSASLSTPRAVKSTPKSTPRRRPGMDQAGALPLGLAPASTIPTFVAQRCLETLFFIVSSNEAALKYFLSEHELPAAFKKSLKKGKGKEKLPPATFYPVVVLLGLFERPALLHASHILEALTSLVSTITKPLVSLPLSENLNSDGAKLVDPATGTDVASGTQRDNADDIPTVSSGDKTVLSTVVTEKAPVIPSTTLRLVVNILTTGECSSRSFSHTLSLIQHLSHLPGARDVLVDELRSRIQQFGDALLVDLIDLGAVLASATATEDIRNVALAKFSPASSTQAQLLRVLKTLDFMFSDKFVTDSNHNAERKDQVRAIYDGFGFGPLWNRLGQCLETVEEQPEATHVATVLLPLIEALMVVCKYSGSDMDADRGRVTVSPMSPLPTSDTPPNLFLSFTSKHRKILNTLVRNNPALMSGSFSLLVLNSKVLEFDNKRNWFFQKLKRKREHVGSGVLQLNVRRQYVFEDSFHMLQRRTGDEIKYGKLSVKFHGEDGVDAGGVTREWYSVLAKQIFDPNFALFEPCAADQLTYQPNKASGINSEHLSYFKFVGRVIGKAVFDNRLLDAYFSRAFYKQILGKPVDLRDVESIDPDFHKSLQWMLDNDITDIVDNDFTTEEVEFGETKTVELKPGGAHIPVTQENKEEYVRLIVSYRLDNSIKEQIRAFLSGFYDIIPQHLVQIFQPDQLELLISGISTIDVDELKNATQLHGWKNSDPEITWFWRALRSFSQEERAQFLMFVTSSSRVPLGGFSQLQGSSGVQPFQIHKLHATGALPSAATCFNLLKLGSYPSYESLRAKLLFAMYEGGGFGLA